MHFHHLLAKCNFYYVETVVQTCNSGDPLMTTPQTHASSCVCVNGAYGVKMQYNKRKVTVNADFNCIHRASGMKKIINKMATQHLSNTLTHK